MFSTHILSSFADKDFPSSFETIVKNILRLLFHVLAHIYHSHFKEIVLLNLHTHLNCIFSHFALFCVHFDLLETSELFVLEDLAIALKILPPHPNKENMQTEPDTNYIITDESQIPPSLEPWPLKD